MHDAPFPPLTDRGSGVLLHPTALPGDQGVGVIGEEAFRFVDFLQEAGVTYWQVLPLGPTGYGDSPYQSLSSHAGNPFLIDLKPLQEFGLLEASDLDALMGLPTNRVDFGALYQVKWPVLRHAWRAFKHRGRAYLPNYGLLDDFRDEHGDAWLNSYATFIVLKEHFQGAAWQDWDPELRTWRTARAHKLVEELEDAISAQIFYQYLFFGQWKLLRDYAQDNGVRFIGDIPIFPALDSADVWASPEFFLLGSDGRPEFVAGVPPDYFSPLGQLWGNPLFDWDALANDGYTWWLERFASAFRTCDAVRLDHFRGFHSYWCVPASAEDARWGEWRDGPGMDFLLAVRKAFPECCLIAEDLGDLSEEAREFRIDSGLPGMAILQFAFDGDPNNLYLPHNLDANTVLYSGTHDNNTILGWYREATDEQRDHVRRYLRIRGDEISWDIIRAAFASVAKIVVIPLQDLLALDASARFNIPGKPDGNWQWRCSADSLAGLEPNTAFYLRELAWLYGR